MSSSTDHIYFNLFEAIVNDKEQVHEYIHKELIKLFQYFKLTSLQNIVVENNLFKVTNIEKLFSFTINHEDEVIKLLIGQVIEKCLLIAAINKKEGISLPWNDYDLKLLTETFQSRI